MYIKRQTISHTTLSNSVCKEINLNRDMNYSVYQFV